MADGETTPRTSASTSMAIIGVMGVTMVGDFMILGYGTTGAMADITVIMDGVDTITHGPGTIGVGAADLDMVGITASDMAFTAIDITIDLFCDMATEIMP